jgi:V8-like Glu-specific endopeptidase
MTLNVPPGASTTLKPTSIPTATEFAGLPAVGALFLNGADGDHGCTASVVRSPSRDLLITAAHCVVGNGAGIQFAPGYHNGKSPYGAWTVQQVYVDPGWVARRDPTQDYAFLRVAPQVRGGTLMEVQDVVGGDDLAVRDMAGQRVQVVGYPVGIDDEPLTCANWVQLDHGSLTFDCHGFLPGTSGAPWLLAAGTGAPTIVGVIGGLHEGGCDEASSYSPTFTGATVRVYRRAVAGTTPDTVPGDSGAGSGC